MYQFQKYTIIWSIGLAISNATTPLDNAINDQVYLNTAIYNLKKYARRRLPEKRNKKKLSLENTNELSLEDNGLFMPLRMDYSWHTQESCEVIAMMILIEAYH